MSASTPAAARRGELVGVVDRPHVDLAGRARAPASRRRAGVAGERPHVGVQRAVPVRLGDRERLERVGARTVSSAVRDVGGERRGPGRRSARLNDDTSTRRGPPGRRAARPAASAARSGDPSRRRSGEFLISMFTSSPAHTSSASASVGTSGRAAADLGRGSARASGPAGVSASWRTTSAPSAVRWTSSSTPSAPSSTARRERRERVLGGQPVGAAVGEDERHAGGCYDEPANGLGQDAEKFLVRPLRRSPAG